MVALWSQEKYCCCTFLFSWQIRSSGKYLRLMMVSGTIALTIIYQPLQQAIFIPLLNQGPDMTIDLSS